MSTDYHAQYLAHRLTRRAAAGDAEKLSRSLLDATVDLNPHQVEAALFAFRSPLSRGAILADEVGLGKTIEAGLVVSQLWAERKRRILCIVPASLRKQWNRELAEKFHIDSVILESKSFKAAVKRGERPFEPDDAVVLCSYEFAKSRIDDVARTPWELVVMDEAHRLRNVYKSGETQSVIAKAIRDAVLHRPKLLLTATPLQNSLMELYGLVSVVDPHLFGDEDSFRARYTTRGAAPSGELEDLKRRIAPVCSRTLRRQVREYVNYTQRLSITEDFTPTPDEARLYEAVSDYLQRDELLAIPNAQRQLITLVLRKILASSSFAIRDTLAKLAGRLEHMAEEAADDDATAAVDDLEHADELAEEHGAADAESAPTAPATSIPRPDPAALAAELAELRSFRDLAAGITENAKGQALLKALRRGFEEAERLGSPRKALIFTESVRTQRYLVDLLESNGYAGEVVTFNGTNADPRSKAIYADWSAKHAGTDVVTGSPTADMRAALVEHFRDAATVMVATESAAEGVNLQFCNLVVNYDLPWNPQRVEQRIGRCHRYGQKYDVVVINFLNRSNAADLRVFELLDEKFRLFDGVFGASDEVLGALESGVDFEKRVADIVQRCRGPEEITAAFDKLQAELEESIETRMDDTRRSLLEHFDETVHDKLKIRSDETRRQVDRYGRWLWDLTRYELGDEALFDAETFAFILPAPPPGVVAEGLDPAAAPPGSYRLVSDPLLKQNPTEADHHYRTGHPLARALIRRAKRRTLPPREVTFDHAGYPAKVSLVERLTGRSGWLRATLLTVTALETEEHLLLAGGTDDGGPLDAETCEKLFGVPGETGAAVDVPPDAAARLDDATASQRAAVLADVQQRGGAYFDAEMEKLDAWAEDLKDGLQREITALKGEVTAAKREARRAGPLAEKLAHQKRAEELKKTLRKKTKRRDEAEEEIDARTEELLDGVEARLSQSAEERELFTIRWRVR